jgi:hypothetical protein
MKFLFGRMMVSGKGVLIKELRHTMKYDSPQTLLGQLVQNPGNIFR